MARVKQEFVFPSHIMQFTNETQGFFPMDDTDPMELGQHMTCALLKSHFKMVWRIQWSRAHTFASAQWKYIFAIHGYDGVFIYNHSPVLIRAKAIEEEKKIEKKLNAAPLSKIEFTMM